MNDNSVLKMQGIGKVFPGVTALDDVDFELLEGEVHILLGENGAGKSTLVKIISGAYQKSSGKIFLSGEEIEVKDPKHAQNLGIGIIYQELNLIPSLTVAENIFLGREFLLMPGVIDQKQMNLAAREILDSLGVNINPESPVGTLGIAQQQMIEVAKALSLHAKILIMDEPTSALSENEINELFATINRLKESGVSVIYISHRLEELFEIGDRVTVLRDGRYVATHNISDIEKSDLIRMMVDRELSEQYPKEKAEIGEEVLRVENLSVDHLLHDINFNLHKGEILGIAGLLGSGRTELARALFGLETIRSGGKIFIENQLCKINSPRKAINKKIGFLTEDRKGQGLVLTLSLKDNICLPSEDRFSKFGFIDEGKEIRTANKYVKELMIKTPGLDQKALYLSGGNQQKLVISKWLCSEADILIFDEPTRGIDVGSKVEIYQLMNALTAKGAAIIMISSDLPEVLGMSDRILVMHEGQISGEYSASEATQEKILHSALGAA